MSLEGKPPLGLLFKLKLSYPKPFCRTLNYVSIVNVEEVIEFYNLGNESFETDFS